MKLTYAYLDLVIKPLEEKINSLNKEIYSSHFITKYLKKRQLKKLEDKLFKCYEKLSNMLEDII